MPEREELNWEAVGKAMAARRKALNQMTQEDLSAVADVSVFVIAEIEQVRIRRRAPGTLERLSKGLRWPPNRLDDILYGRSQPLGSTPESPEQVLLSIRDELDSLSSRVDGLLSRYDIVWQPRHPSDPSVELDSHAYSHEQSAAERRDHSADG